jgi:hypothetical protein
MHPGGEDMKKTAEKSRPQTEQSNLNNQITENFSINDHSLQDFQPLTGFRVISRHTEPLTKNRVIACLDLLQGAIHTGNPNVKLIEDLYEALNFAKNELSQEEWSQFVKNKIESHPIYPLVLQDPCTQRSYSKPRGYPGDAGLIDFFYKKANLISETKFGDHILNYTISRDAAQAVRERATLIASYIDKIALKKNDSRILSIASGHLREAGLSRAVFEGRIAEFISLDQDDKSLEVVRSEFSSFNITPVHCPISSLLLNKVSLGKFDFVYASGLFDYLNDKLAKRLIKYMFNALLPGGKLLITNFLTTTKEIGYMSAFMHWDLIFRDMGNMEDLVKDLDHNLIEKKKVFKNSYNNIVYLEITKMNK